MLIPSPNPLTLTMIIDHSMQGIRLKPTVRWLKEDIWRAAGKWSCVHYYASPFQNEGNSEGWASLCRKLSSVEWAALPLEVEILSQ